MNHWFVTMIDQDQEAITLQHKVTTSGKKNMAWCALQLLQLQIATTNKYIHNKQQIS